MLVAARTEKVLHGEKSLEDYRKRTYLRTLYFQTIKKDAGKTAEVHLINSPLTRWS